MDKRYGMNNRWLEKSEVIAARMGQNNIVEVEGEQQHQQRREGH